MVFIKKITSIHPNTFEWYPKNRNLQEAKETYRLLPDITIKPTSIEGSILNKVEHVPLSYTIRFFQYGIFRFTLREEKACYIRKEVTDVLIEAIEAVPITVKNDEHSATIKFGFFSLKMNFDEFVLSLFHGSEQLLEINKRSLFNFDHLPHEPLTGRRGPRSVALDFSFPQSKGLYGLLLNILLLSVFRSHSLLPFLGSSDPFFFIFSSRGPEASFDRPIWLFSFDAVFHFHNSVEPLYGIIHLIISRPMEEKRMGCGRIKRKDGVGLGRLMERDPGFIPVKATLASHYGNIRFGVFIFVILFFYFFYLFILVFILFISLFCFLVFLPSPPPPLKITGAHRNNALNIWFAFLFLFIYFFFFLSNSPSLSLSNSLYLSLYLSLFFFFFFSLSLSFSFPFFLFPSKCITQRHYFPMVGRNPSS
jgi:hypothetical protein